jgi:amino acid transporter
MGGKILRLLLGPYKATKELEEQKVGVFQGVPMLGLDALGSAAYGPEAALTILLAAGAAGLTRIVPIMLVILVVLAALYFSYLQTIAAYPNGGGSYTVAGENLGQTAGLVAAAALLVDYSLDVAVGISAGVGALISAFPTLKPHTLTLCLVVLALIYIINMRGVKESGSAFAPPTYLFILCLGVVLTIGLAKTIMAGGHPQAVVAPHQMAANMGAVSLWLLIRAFASGCTAMTGVEAVSNGMGVFRDPPVKHAQRTLTVICVTLGALLIGIAFLCSTYKVGATVPNSREYESVLSQLIGAIVGRGWFYYLSIASILAVLTLSANTGFAGFPRLCRLLGRDAFLPRSFEDLSRRLVYSIGISTLTAIAGALLIIFGGITDRLIPLFAVGAFLAFSLSQAGMVVHWMKRREEKHARLSLFINGFGCVATSITLAVVLAAKFVEGAWITIILIPGLVLLFLQVKTYYLNLGVEIEKRKIEDLNNTPPIVVLTISRWNAVSAQALNFACSISPDIFVLHISTTPEDTQRLQEQWKICVEEPLASRGMHPPSLSIVESRFRELERPLLKYVNLVKEQHPKRQVAVIVPELVHARWYQRVMHRAYEGHLKRALLSHGSDGVVIVSVPWRLRD